MTFLSFIVGFRNKEPERVKLFLSSLEKQSDKDFELIFIDYGSDEKISNVMESLVRSYTFAKYYFFNSRGQNWNRSKCLNYGFTLSAGQFIFTSDIDFLFAENFVARCRELASPNDAKYFKVGFLSESQSINISSPLSDIQVKEYSNEDAVGPLFISTSMFKAIGGYDEFFEIWGLEDNDLRHRVGLTKYTILFYSSETLIWHVWHLPMKRSGFLPKGWLKFLTDYFEHKKTTIVQPDQNFYCRIDPARPIIHEKSRYKSKSFNVNFGQAFLNQFLTQELEKLDPKELLEIKFDFKSHTTTINSRLNRWIKKLNHYFLKINIPVNLANRNMNAYINEVETRDVILYFIKNNSVKIRDYYIPQDLARESFFLLKR